MALRPDQFSFKPGSIKTELTVERLEALRKAVIAAKPSPGGHVNLMVKQTPQGWMGEAKATGRGGGGARQFTVALVQEGFFPTIAEIQTAIEGKYTTEDTTPRIGDYLFLTRSNEVRLAYRIWEGPVSGTETVFNVGILSNSFVARGQQIGMY